MKRRRAPLARAVAAAQQVLEIRGVRTPEEIDLEAIAVDLGAQVRRGAIRNAEGRLVRSGRNGVITIDVLAYLSEKWRFVLAHEIGHILLHEYREKLDCFLKKTAPPEERSRSYLDEKAASDFGVELFLPTGMVRPRYDRAATPMDRARSLAACFGASPVTAALRTLDFTEEPCAVAYSEGGTVRWCTATRAFGVNVPDLARAPRAGGAGRARAVDAEVWGRACAGVEVEALYEASVTLEPFDAMVTMLWHEPREAPFSSALEGSRPDFVA
jgi:hypothetical protein